MPPERDGGEADTEAERGSCSGIELLLDLLDGCDGIPKVCEGTEF